MSRRQQLATIFKKTGGLNLINSYWGANRITVLAYHRIIEWNNPDFADYEPVVSATPTMFEQQMNYVAQNFNVISLVQLQNFLFKNEALPERPLLITFDDGYIDNYQYAFPVLKKLGFPAVIFLVTSRMTNPTRLWWDEVAYAFHHTQKTTANLPLIGEHSWSNGIERNSIRESLIQRLKSVSEGEKLQAVAKTSMVLDVAPSQDKLFISWEQVRELVSHNVACQPHTVTHPIMTRINPEEVHQQLAQAKADIERETGQIADAFAYPNGTPTDYDQTTINMLRETGYTTAFTLVAGPIKAEDAQKQPFQIKRVYLGNKDTMEIYATKVMGVPALFDKTPYL